MLYTLMIMYDIFITVFHAHDTWYDKIKSRHISVFIVEWIIAGYNRENYDHTQMWDLK